jgi:plasmid maintenance system antidote protein VapI
MWLTLQMRYDLAQVRQRESKIAVARYVPKEKPSRAMPPTSLRG